MDCKIIFTSRRHGEQNQNVVLFPPTCFYSFITLKKSEANCSPLLSSQLQWMMFLWWATASDSLLTWRCEALIQQVLVRIFGYSSRRLLVTGKVFSHIYYFLSSILCILGNTTFALCSFICCTSFWWLVFILFHNSISLFCVFCGRRDISQDLSFPFQFSQLFLSFFYLHLLSQK